jgi:hypothetical protein
MLFLQLYGKILIFDNFFKITKQRSLLFLEGSLLNVCKELLVFLSFSAGRTTSILFPDGQKGEGGRKGRGEGRRVEELIRAKLSKPVILKRYKTL